MLLKKGKIREILCDDFLDTININVALSLVYESHEIAEFSVHQFLAATSVGKFQRFLKQCPPSFSSYFKL